MKEKTILEFANFERARSIAEVSYKSPAIRLPVNVHKSLQYKTFKKKFLNLKI